MWACRPPAPGSTRAVGRSCCGSGPGRGRSCRRAGHVLTAEAHDDDAAQVLLGEDTAQAGGAVLGVVRADEEVPGPAQLVLLRVARQQIALDGLTVQRGEVVPAGRPGPALRGGDIGADLDSDVLLKRVGREELPVLFELRVDPLVDRPAVLLADRVRGRDVQEDHAEVDTRGNSDDRDGEGGAYLVREGKGRQCRAGGLRGRRGVIRRAGLGRRRRDVGQGTLGLAGLVAPVPGVRACLVRVHSAPSPDPRSHCGPPTCPHTTTRRAQGHGTHGRPPGAAPSIDPARPANGARRTWTGELSTAVDTLRPTAGSSNQPYRTIGR